MHRITCAASFTLVLCLTHTLLAQPEEPEQAADPPAEREPAVDPGADPPDDDIPRSPAALPETVITATRTLTPRTEVGSTITVIPDELIEHRQDRFVLDSLTTSPGVDIRRQGGVGSQSSIFTRGTNSNHTLFRADGIKLHDPAAPPGAPAIDHLATDNIGRIEVLRGPQSTLYGSDAIGGVINLVTERGAGDPTLSLSVEGGSFDTWVGRMRAGGGDDRFDFSLGVSHFRTGGIVTTDAASEPNAARNTSFAARSGFRFSDEFGVDLFSRVMDVRIEFDGGADPDATVTDSIQHAMKIEPYLLLADGLWETRLALAHSRIDRENRGENFPMFAQFPSASFGRISQVEWQNIFRISEDNTLTLGVDYEASSARFERPDTPRVDASTGNVGFYLQDQLRLWDRLFLTLGGRVDRDEDFGTELTYRAAAAYKLHETDTIFRGSIGTGFKAPTLAQRFDDAFGTANPALDPERSRGFDLGIEQALFDERLNVAATYFRNDLKDMIVGAGPDFQNVNIDRAVTQGLELALTGRLTDSLLAQLAYTYTDTEARRAEAFGIRPGSRLLRRPLHKLSFDVNYLFLDERAQVGVNILYVGERDDIDPDTFATVTADDYVVVNLTGSFDITPNVVIFGRIENLFDESYQDVLGFNTPGIGAFAGVRITF